MAGRKAAYTTPLLLWVSQYRTGQADLDASQVACGVPAVQYGVTVGTCRSNSFRRAQVLRTEMTSCSSYLVSVDGLEILPSAL